MALKTDYKEDILDTSKNTRRKYKMIDNGDETVSFEDVTEYTQTGDTFGAADINNTNSRIEEVFQLGSNVKAELVTALQYSGLGITPESTWEEVYAALSRKFPAYYELLDASRWMDKNTLSCFVNSITSDGTYLTIVTSAGEETTDAATQETWVCTDEMDLTNMTVLNIAGTFLTKAYHNNATFAGYIELLKDGVVVETLYSYSKTGSYGDPTEKSIAVSKDVSSLSGFYTIRVRNVLNNQAPDYCYHSFKFTAFNIQ